MSSVHVHICLVTLWCFTPIQRVKSPQGGNREQSRFIVASLARFFFFFFFFFEGGGGCCLFVVVFFFIIFCLHSGRAGKIVENKVNEPLAHAP